MTLLCIHCGSEGRIQVQAVVSAPGTLYHALSKANFRSKDVYFMGVLWETTDFICGNEKCRRVSKGYGNYVTNLKAENEQLKKRVKELENDNHEHG